MFKKKHVGCIDQLELCKLLSHGTRRKGDMVVHQIIIKHNMSESEILACAHRLIMRIWLIFGNFQSSHFEYLNQVRAHAARCTKSTLVAFVLSMFAIKNTERYLKKNRKLCNVVQCRSRVMSVPGDYFLDIMSHNVHMSLVFRWQMI